MKNTRPSGNAGTILKNSFWYGLETVFEMAVALGTTIVIARVIGPQRLGYFQYVSWLTLAGATLGTIGIPVTIRKYVAEYLGRGELGIVRAIVLATLKVQFLISFILMAAGLSLVYTVSDPSHHTISALLVASMMPHMLRGVPAQVNVARERMILNVPGTLIGSSLYALAVTLSLMLGWDLLGIAAGGLLYRWVELFVRMAPVLRWVEAMPKAPLPEAVRRRMVTFSGMGLVLLLLRLVIWDRSDIVFLKLLSPDIRQVTFYSVAFNLTEKVFLLPQVFASAVTATLSAEYGRNAGKIAALGAEALRFMAVMAMPVFIGLALLSDPIVRLVYGAQYLPVIPVLAMAACFALPKILFSTGQPLLETTENQKPLITYSIVAAVINVALDLVLIPQNGALGAVMASGIAQAVAALGIWSVVVRKLELRIPWRELIRTGVSVSAMALCVAALVEKLNGNPLETIVLATAAGGAVYTAMLRLTHSLRSEDRTRLLRLGAKLPRLLRGSYERAAIFVAPAGANK